MQSAETFADELSVRRSAAPVASDPLRDAALLG
jgi:hypothetical protein